MINNLIKRFVRNLFPAVPRPKVSSSDQWHLSHVLSVGATYIASYMSSKILTKTLNALLAKPKSEVENDTSYSTKKLEMYDYYPEAHIIYGQCHIPLTVVYSQLKAAYSSKKNKLYLVGMIANHPVERSSNIYINGKILRTYTSGSRSGLPIRRYAYFRGQEAYARVQLYNGTSTGFRSTPSAMINCPNWTTRYSFKNVSCAFVSLISSSSLYGNPLQLPSIMIEVSGKQVPNTKLEQITSEISSTNPVPKVWSSNPALCLADYLINVLKVPKDCINLESFNHAVDYCNESITRSGSTSARYTCNGRISLNQPSLDIINSLLTSMCGTLVYWQGMLNLHLYEHADLVPTIHSEDLLTHSEEIENSDFQKENFNSIQALFLDYSSLSTYQYTEIYEDGNLLAPGELPALKKIILPFTNNRIMAEALAKKYLYQLQESQKLLKLTLKITQFRLCLWSLVKLSWVDNLLYRIVHMEIHPDFTVQVILKKEIPQALE